MITFKSTFLIASLAAGGITFFGCSSNSDRSTTSNHDGFQGGTGAFGETPEAVGAHAAPAAKKAASSDENNKFQGGNGAFGQTPEKPGDSSSTPRPSATPDQNNKFQGGNGTFGETPEKPGK